MPELVITANLTVVNICDLFHNVSSRQLRHFNSVVVNNFGNQSHSASIFWRAICSYPRNLPFRVLSGRRERSILPTDA